MFGLGFTELLVIMVVVLLVFGPKHLPSAARSLGRALAEFRRSVDEVKREINSPMLDDRPQENAALPKPPAIQVVDLSSDPTAHENCETCDPAKTTPQS